MDAADASHGKAFSGRSGQLCTFLPLRTYNGQRGNAVLNRMILTAWVLLFPAACTTLGAAGVFLLRRQARPCTQRILCGMAAGIMLAASVWSLLLPAIERGRGLALPAWIPSAIGLVLGAVGLLQVEQFAGQLLAGGAGHSGRMILAVTLHNLPLSLIHI